MTATRLSALDTSFLQVESPTAHMHVGWVSLFTPPTEGPRPGFVELRDHIASRLARAPRYRQKITPVPFGLNDPLWIDDDCFDVTRHVRRAREPEIGAVVNRVMSKPLDRTRPLWELSIADELEDGRLGIVGKAHHCMVDGIAAVELAALLLDPTREPPPPEPDEWRASPPPGRFEVLTGSVKDRLTEQLDLLRWPGRLASSPGRVLGLAQDGHRAARALVNSFFPLAPPSMLNRPNSPLRHLALLGRELEDFRQIKRHFRTTVNDVVLAASSGGVRRFVSRHGEEPRRLKTMVPVNLRGDDGQGQFGNRISFLFVELPCDEPDPVRRLLDIHVTMSDRKDSGGPQGGDSVLKLVSHAPHQLQNVVSKLVSSPRTFNLVVSNIPGPREPLYMHGCELQEAYPIVPLADQHALSIGITTIKDGAFFGIYADRKLLPDAQLLARDIDASVDELLAQV
jgi:diacylglycerol O-acyltransferase / wax synthase